MADGTRWRGWDRYLTSAYPFGMIFALALWPQLSDTIGRRPVLALSLVGVGIGFIAQVSKPCRPMSNGCHMCRGHSRKQLISWRATRLVSLSLRADPPPLCLVG